MSLRDPQTQRDAREGFKEISDRLEEIIGHRVREVDSIVRFIRQIPADDGRKKEELSRYFQSAAGSKYTREERHEAYNDLLGVERNRERSG